MAVLRSTLRVTLAAVVLSTTGDGAELVQPAARRPACAIDARTSTWIQRALDGWDRVSRDALRLPPAPLPWTVFYDEKCAWHMGYDEKRLSGAVRVASAFRQRPYLSADGRWQRGAAIPVLGVPHAGDVWLPDDSVSPAAETTARASLYGPTSAPYFVMATLDAWRRDPAIAREADADRFFLGVAIHELTHTRHLPHVLERARAIATQYGLTDLRLDDDVIQHKFGGRPGFQAAFEAERDLLYQAVAQPDRANRRALIRQALDLAARRRARYYVDGDRPYQDFEDLFLSMEGVGQWAALALLSDVTTYRPRREAIEVVRDNRKYWSQEEGLALFLLLDLESADWRRQTFHTPPAAPFALLEAALRAHVPVTRP